MKVKLYFCEYLFEAVTFSIGNDSSKSKFNSWQVKNKSESFTFASRF